MKKGPGDDDFDLSRGLHIIVDDDDDDDDDVARKHYQDKYEAEGSKFDGDEMLRRYRFSVVITKLVEAL